MGTLRTYVYRYSPDLPWMFEFVDFGLPPESFGLVEAGNSRPGSRPPPRSPKTFPLFSCNWLMSLAVPRSGARETMAPIVSRMGRSNRVQLFKR